jgi:hypothetical protein
MRVLCEGVVCGCCVRVLCEGVEGLRHNGISSRVS